MGINSRAKLPKSQRDAFVKWVFSNRADLKDLLILPENYTDWNEFDIYSDLLLFETDLSLLTSAVVVFVEAAGAIAELGAFSQIKALSQRLVVVVTDNRHPKKSFISLGPIRSVEITQKHASSVCVIPNANRNSLAVYMPVVAQTLDDKRKLKTITASFSKDELQHQILLVLDFINLFLLTTITELQNLSRLFSIEFPLSRLHQILFVLEKTGLISKQRYGTTEYFSPRNHKKPYLDFTATTGLASFNRTRAMAIRLSEIDADSHRKIAYAAATKGGV